MKKQSFTALIIFLAVFAYAVIRYNVIKGVPWVELPLFISNKAISLSAVVFIALSYALGSLSRFWPKTFVPALTMRKFFGLLGFGLAAIHVFISLLIFTPVHFSDLSIIFGVLAFFVFAIVALASIPAIAATMEPQRWLKVQRLGYFGLLLVFFHVFTMGFKGWLKPGGWPGGLLPISLIAAIVIAFVLLLKIAAMVFPKKADEIKI